MMFVAVCLCGGLGSIARFVCNASIQRWWNRVFPLSTIVINILACMCAGSTVSAYSHGTVGQASYLLLVTGFLGGFSTFSTAVNELVSLGRNRHVGTALSYGLLTIVLPLAFVAFGWWLVAFAS